MRRFLFVPLAIGFAVHSFCDEPQIVVPTHLQAPQYPIIAKTAHISGEVEVQVTIAVDGSVADAMAVDGPRLLYRSSQDAVLKWRFVKPSRAPLVETVFCDYKLNPATKNATSEVLVTFDLPNRVAIVATPELIQTYN
jgi:hypothetical protein